jgi:transmembrane 9 superfamily member 2/4
MLRNSSCNVICSTSIPSSQVTFRSDAAFINHKIKEGYHLNWLIDGLPAAGARIDIRKAEPVYSVGFGLGYVVSEEYELGYIWDITYFNNHYELIVEYHVTLSWL